MKKIGLLIGEGAYNDPSTDPDIECLKNAIEKLNLNADIIWWQDANVNWGDYDALVIRSVWDYIPNYDKFINWCKGIEKIVPLFNSA